METPYIVDRKKWNAVSTPELLKAFELLITPADLMSRDVAVALFEVLAFSPEDILEAIREGKYIGDDWHFYGLNTIRPQIIPPTEK